MAEHAKKLEKELQHQKQCIKLLEVLNNCLVYNAIGVFSEENNNFRIQTMQYVTLFKEYYSSSKYLFV